MTIEDEAKAALEGDAGCSDSRAVALVKAVGEAVAEEALEVVAGSAQAFGSALDRRVATLARIVEKLPGEEPLPSYYEVGVIFRITPAQGRNVLRIYQARFSKRYRAHLQQGLDEVEAKRERHADTNVFVFDFDDPALLEYAVEKLSRRGLTRSVTVDKTKLQIVVDRGERDRLGKDAATALKAA
jgi:cation transport regulator ChaC